MWNVISRSTAALAGLLVLTVPLGCASTSGRPGSLSTAHRQGLEDGSRLNVRYEVECGRCRVRYRLPGGRSSAEVEGSWSHSFRAGDGERLTLTVREGDRPSSLVGRIYFGGEVVQAESVDADAEQRSFTLTLVTGR